MANAVGLLVLLLLVGVLAKLLQLGNSGFMLWVVAYLVLAAVAWCTWQEKDGPTSPMEWLGMALGAALLGAVFFAIDVSFGHSKNSALPMLAAAQMAGGMFGFAFTVAVCPGLVLIAVAGMARSAYLSRRSDA